MRKKITSYTGRKNNYDVVKDLMQKFIDKLSKQKDFIKRKNLLEEMFPIEGLFE